MRKPRSYSPTLSQSPDLVRKDLRAVLQVVRKVRNCRSGCDAGLGHIDGAISSHLISTLPVFFDPPGNYSVTRCRQDHNILMRRFQPYSARSFHLNFQFSRNNFQVPNQFDQQAIGQDQRQRVNTCNIAPGYVHSFADQAWLLTVNHTIASIR